MSLVGCSEEAVCFGRAPSRLWGVVSRPAPQIAPSKTAVLIVVGGPQYRVGSHRQFVVLARTLASAGFASLRFDCTGMGDSAGGMRDFEALGPDLLDAIDALSQACPGATRLAVWGLCDGASAALMFTTNDPRVVGIVAANPWARSDTSLAAARVKHYYTARVLQADFWRKLFRGGVNWSASLGSLVSNLRGARGHARNRSEEATRGGFQSIMAEGLIRLRGRLLLILSGNDLTAKEFVEYVGTSNAWRGLLQDPKVSRIDLADADHTFSQRHCLDKVCAETITWLTTLGDLAGIAVLGNSTKQGNP